MTTVREKFEAMSCVGHTIYQKTDSGWTKWIKDTVGRKRYEDIDERDVPHLILAEHRMENAQWYFHDGFWKTEILKGNEGSMYSEDLEKELMAAKKELSAKIRDLLETAEKHDYTLRQEFRGETEIFGPETRKVIVEGMRMLRDVLKSA